MKKILLLFALCSLICSCGNDSTETDPNAGKYLKGFIGSWIYEGHQLYPYGKQSTETLSTLTINSDGTFSFKGESMFIPEEVDSERKPRIIDDKGTWSFDNNKGVLSLTKKIVDYKGNTHEEYFYYTITYPDNGMTFSGTSSYRDRRWYFTKK